MIRKQPSRNTISHSFGDVGSHLSAVVRLDMTVSSPNIMMPWQNYAQTFTSGSGVVIEGNHILTNAHNISDATRISVRKLTDDEPYDASIVAVDHDCDLALLAVCDNRFFDDIQPMEIGNTPPVRSKVQVAGYPLGGSGLSITQGIISRIEEIPYAHSGERLLAAQLDAAINPGNSGGPVISDGKIVGLAFQGILFSSSIGYMIHTEIIKHFLDDLKNSIVDGFATDFIKFIPLINPDMRQHLKMQPEMTGVLAFDFRIQPPEDTLMTNDVLMEIDNHKITNSGHIKTEEDEFRSFMYAIKKKQVGDKVKFHVLRKGKHQDVIMPVLKYAKLCQVCRKPTPAYYIFGGFLFMPFYRNIYDYLTSNKAHEEGIVVKESHLDKLRPLLNQYRKNVDEEPVLLLNVLVDKANYGYSLFDPLILEKVNRTRVRNLRHLISIIEQIPQGDVQFIFHGNIPVVVDINKMRCSNQRILENYRIPLDRCIV